MKLLILILSLFLASNSSARVLKSSEQGLNILIFNIQKTNNWSWNQGVFDQLVRGSDIALVQEAVDDMSYPAGTQFRFYKSWGSTGIATLSDMEPALRQIMVSPGAEPILGTPKVSSIEVYPLKKSDQKLMVVNTHGLNFKSLSSFQDQMNEIVDEVFSHKGPMIWAGDFNTWNIGRWQYLLFLTKMLELQKVDFKNRNELFFELDHAFVRGMNVLQAEQLEIDISDHRPLQMTVEIH